MSVYESGFGHLIPEKEDGFLISQNDFDQLPDINIFGYLDSDWLWNNSIHSFFRNCIFRTDNNFTFNDNEVAKTIIYYPRKRKTYLINTSKVDYFVNKYFQNYKIINRSSEFYSFMIPIPEIYNFCESSKHDDRLNVCIGKFKNTYQPIENYVLRINPLSRGDFDFIFQREFSSIYSIIEKYKEYLRHLLGVDPENINCNTLFTPYYLINQDELTEILKIFNRLANDEHEAQIRDSEDKLADKHEKWLNAEMDELNRQAFENNPENYWNID